MAPNELSLLSFPVCAQLGTLGLIENSSESVKSPGFKPGFNPIIHESKRLFNSGGWATAPGLLSPGK